MNSFSELTAGAQIIGLVPGGKPVWIITTIPTGEDSLQVIYKKEDDSLSEQTLYRQDLGKLSIAKQDLSWSFTADAESFRLALEALRIRMGSLFDPMMAVHSSNIEPLPHQISAVYESMLPKQPLRFVLADDPGAGKTIMAGLLIKELIMRADAERILIVAPGSLTEQWQDELLDKFALNFKIFSGETQNLSASGNYFNDENLVIARIDQLARNDDYKKKLQSTQWDLIIVDEAHKMSAHAIGNKTKKTQRYLLGEMLGSITRHFLLMTATPHSGSNEDFQLWLSLLDPDIFYRPNFSRHSPNTILPDVMNFSYFMRRMVKENLLKFDGTRLFPKREATTVEYTLSEDEAHLYDRVTKYVVEEMNRAKRMTNSAKRNQVGFALTILQRRVASSPEAIYQSLDRRLSRLKKELRDNRMRIAQGQVGISSINTGNGNTPTPAWDDFDEDDLAPEDWETMVDATLSASTASSIEELRKEINTLSELTKQAKSVRDSNEDRKWSCLSEMLQTNQQLLDSEGKRHKLIIFTEHKDTLNYLEERISGLLGSKDKIRTISGSTNRETRRQIQEDFCNDPEVCILIATDAAGEGVNLQAAHLLINYDLPWNPNRLEQRFGRIHRIGQTETCVMWNMVAADTREGQVFAVLFQKLEEERQALGGQVFDILGEAFKDKPLKDLLLDAIEKENSEEARQWMTEKVKSVLNDDALREIMARNVLVEQAMSKEALYAVKAELDKAEARKLQPYFVRAFFLSAYQSELIRGSVVKREPGRYELRHVPHSLLLLSSDELHPRTPLARRYERICFEKELIRRGPGLPRAEFVHPGHPLMQAVIEKVLSAYRGLIKSGAVLVDPADDKTEPYLIVMMQHTVREASSERPVSQILQFVRISQTGECTRGGWAPHLDLRAPKAEEQETVQGVLKQAWIKERDWKKEAMAYATERLSREHYNEVRTRLGDQADKIQKAVLERLIPAIYKYNGDAQRYEEQLRSGKAQANAQPANARKKAEELSVRLERKLKQLDIMRNPISSAPIVQGCMLVVPQGYINKALHTGTFCTDESERRRIEQIAMQAVIEREKSFGHSVSDVSAEKCGWDVTAQPPSQNDYLPDARHIEVKGRSKDATVITVTSNEIRAALNQRDKYILAIVLVDGERAEEPRYIRAPFKNELMDGQVSGNFDIAALLGKSLAPEDTL
mgnify:CR=1 FL=1